MYFNLQYSVLYGFQYNEHEAGRFFFLGEEASSTSHLGVCVHYIAQYTVHYTVQFTVYHTV